MRDKAQKKSLYKKNKLTSSVLSKSQTSDSHGLLSRAPGVDPYRYIFSNTGDVSTSFCSCIPALYENKT